MQATSEIIFEAAMKLPEPERLALVSKLLETMPAEDAGSSFGDVSLLDELDRRFNDREGSMSWTELRAEQ